MSFTINRFLRSQKSFSGAFSLVELLVVMALATVLGIIAIPAISGTTMAGSVNQAVTDISLSIEQARAYAMAHDTYVWMGLAPSQDSQTTLIVGMVAGTTGSPGDLGTANYIPVARLQRYPNFDLASVSTVEASTTSTSWSTTIPSGTEATALSTSTLTPFSQTIGVNNVAFPRGSILQFDPLGEASITAPGLLQIPHWIQFGLQRQNGGSGNVAVIQIAGLSGQVQVFRP
jgi:Tfp pilus assembly protein FimT